MRARSAGRLYYWLDNVGARVRDGLVCCAGRCMDLIPRAEHEVGRMRLSMELAHLVRGGNFDSMYAQEKPKRNPKAAAPEAPGSQAAGLKYWGGRQVTAPHFFQYR